MFAPRTLYCHARKISVRTSRFRVSSCFMRKMISLTDQEKTLRQLLLEVSDYIGLQEGCTRPELRITGGWVRDRLLGVQSKDIDIGISSMTGSEFGRMMKEYLTNPEPLTKYGEGTLGRLAEIVANPEKSKHLDTVTTNLLGFDVDLVNLRKEEYAEHSRIPTVKFGSPEEDALRRDATVNALFYNLSTSEVEDFTGRGLEDMKLKIIRTPLPSYQTFKDDPLRILRCIRFASKLGYEIDPATEISMGNPEIKIALRDKISRERVGIEIEKMLRGPEPCTALGLIHRLDLYDTIFIDPKSVEVIGVKTEHWASAYEEIRSSLKDKSDEHQLIRNILFRDKEDEYLAWILVALVPWARVKSSSKPAAGRVAREGLKRPSAVCKVVDEAVLNITDVIQIKNAFLDEINVGKVPQKRKHESLDRGRLGMKVRQWGPHWRSCVIFALALELLESKQKVDCQRVFKEYATWLRALRDFRILDVCGLKHVIDGRRVKAICGSDGGPWMKEALDVVMEWQLRNPEDPNIEKCEAKVKEWWEERRAVTKV